jgi:hypothetical protein
MTAEMHYRLTQQNGVPMKPKLKLAFAAILVTMGSSAAYAQYVRDVTSDPDATMNEEQKLGPNAYSYRVGNATITTQTPWGYGWRPYYRYHYYRRR